MKFWISVVCVILSNLNLILGLRSSARNPLLTAHAQCPLSCAGAKCPDVTSCQYGTKLGICGCCLYCLKGLGEFCSNPARNIGTCAPGFGCVDIMLSPILPFDESALGRCNDRDINGNSFPGRNGCPTSCSSERCDANSLCFFGSKPDECNCCKECLKGPGESCAGNYQREGECSAGLVCLDENMNLILPMKNSVAPVGRCWTLEKKNEIRKRTASTCPVSCGFRPCYDGSDCSTTKPSELRCGCCNLCLKKLEEPCGGPNQEAGICGPGLGCVDEKWLRVGPYKNNEVGTCRPRDAKGKRFPGYDGCPTSCKTVICGDFSKCPFGSIKSRCGCCDECLKGPGETCGGSYGIEGVCASGLMCFNGEFGVINPRKKPDIPVGRCMGNKVPSKSCSIDCSLVLCPAPDSLGCKFGLGIGQCGCCRACLKGKGEACGGREMENGRCDDGLSCLDSKGKVAVDGAGTCASRSLNAGFKTVLTKANIISLPPVKEVLNYG